MRVRHGIPALRGFTDTNGIHYYSPCLTSRSLLTGVSVDVVTL
jgi:hypothetical protein